MALIFGWIVTDVVFAVAVSLALSSVYYAQVFKYWKKRGVYHIEPTFFFGNFCGVAFQRESPGECLRRIYERSVGQALVGIYAFSQPQLVIRDLSLVESILVKDAHAFLGKDLSLLENASPLLSRSLSMLEGRNWRDTRMKLIPALTSGKMKGMFSLINERCRELVKFITQEISEGRAVDMKDAAAGHYSNVLASCVFGMETNALTDPNCEFRHAMRKVLQPSVMQRVILVLSLCLPWILPLLRKITSLDEVDEFIQKTFRDVAERRKKSRTLRNDFVSLLMQIGDDVEVRPEDSEDAEEVKRDRKYMNMEYSKENLLDVKLDGDEVVAQAFCLALAGSWTSTSVVALTLLELAHNPAVQDRLRGEMNNALGRHKVRLSYDCIAHMTYLDMVVSESLRKYPAIPTLERKCATDYKVPGTSITIEKGTSVVIPLQGIHADPKIYPAPDKFDPERFNSENKSKRSQFAHLPFGKGPRICIGTRFAQVLVKTALVHILTTFRVWPCPGTPKPPLVMRPFPGPLYPRDKVVLAFTELQ